MGNLFATESFARRHLGSNEEGVKQLLAELDLTSREELIAQTIPEEIRSSSQLRLSEALTEQQALKKLADCLGKNQFVRSLIGQGYHDTVLPPVIQRTILENPGWYTAYTPYQAEIAQGRLEALLNFQTMVCDLTGLDVANASLLDEGTAVAEAMALAFGAVRKASTFFADAQLHPQSLDVLRCRAQAAGVELLVGCWREFDPSQVEGLAGAVVQLPDTQGKVHQYSEFFAKVKQAGGVPICAADPLALVLTVSPGTMGAEIAVGSTQRFGVPLGYGGPHAAYIAVADKHKRKLPGRIVGISKDSQGNAGLRLALQTREQHIRRDKATSNICTAQVLLAVLASMYAVYHGESGLRAMAEKIHSLTAWLAEGLIAKGYACAEEAFFDAITVATGEQTTELLEAALAAGFNLGVVEGNSLRINLDECSTEEEVEQLALVFGVSLSRDSLDETGQGERFLPSALRRNDSILTDPVFHENHTETEMMRYIKRLESRDLALNESMIALGSCTMKLNAAAELMPLSWKETGKVHPFAPLSQAQGWLELATELEQWLAEITGFDAVSLQPNAGAQGEFAGLLAIRRYHDANGDQSRNICLIPVSAHGTNPATAAMCGMKIVPVACLENGDIDLEDLRAKAEKYSQELAALMVTYPSTHGVFEKGICRICETVHAHGGQVYMDGANMNAQVGLTSPGIIGADVCHLNLHKTFAIPHGGGGPGVGPIGVASHLTPYLPGHAFLGEGRRIADANLPVSAAPFGSASILTISWMYIAMMGAEGLTEATNQAILNANYLAEKLSASFPILYKGEQGRVAHECIVDLRPLTKESGLTIDDVAKRLIDYGFHAPTMSFPVPGTLMIEPTESESKAELDRFANAMLQIATEMKRVVAGEWPVDDNPLVNSPHTSQMVGSDEWSYSYSRSEAAWPDERLRKHKFWPYVGRIDNVHGDRNLLCTCEGMDSYTS